MDPHTALYAASAALVTLISVAFLVVFAREPWRRHTFGQSVMLLTLGIILLSLLGLLNYIFGPDYWGREGFVLGGRGLIVIGMTQRLVVLVRERRANPRS